jgi:hypothetical protein
MNKEQPDQRSTGPAAAELTQDSNTFTSSWKRVLMHSSEASVSNRIRSELSAKGSDA